MQPLMEFSLLPEQASSIAFKTDMLYLFLVSVTVVFTLLVLVLVMGFAIKYRRGSDADRTVSPDAHHYGMILEITWSVIPLVLTMVMFVWGAALYFEIKEEPEDTMQIYCLGKQWMWKFQHPNGKREINQLHIPVNQPIRMKMVSEDVIHSLYFPAFRVKQDVLPGRYTSMWFTPTKVGTYHLFCAEYCGTGHASEMVGEVVVMTEADYADWLVGGGGEESAVEAGERLVAQHSCNTCHKEGVGARAPSFKNLYGSTVPLRGGGTALVDDEFVRQSIYEPNAMIDARYKPVMPSYKNQLSEEEVLQIIAYLKSISDNVEEEVGMQTGPELTPEPGLLENDDAEAETENTRGDPDDGPEPDTSVVEEVED